MNTAPQAIMDSLTFVRNVGARGPKAPRHPATDRVRHIVYKYEMELGELRPLEGEEAQFIKVFFAEHPRRSEYPPGPPTTVYVYRNVEWGNRWMKCQWGGGLPLSFSFKEVLGEKKVSSGYAKKLDSKERSPVKCAF